MKYQDFALESRAQGFTLVELIVAIVVIAIASITAVGLTSAISMRSAEELRRHQATIVATAYLEEIIGKPVLPLPGGATRATFDDVDDYAGLTNATIRDHRDVNVAGLAGYSAQIGVQTMAFGPTIPANRARLITVTVTDPDGQLTTVQAMVTEP